MRSSCSSELCTTSRSHSDSPTAISLSCYFDVDKLFRCLSGLLSAVIHPVGSPRNTPVADLYKNFNTLTIPDLHIFQILILIPKFLHHKDKLPVIFTSYFNKNFLFHNHDTRNRDNLHLVRCKTSYGSRSVKYNPLWNLNSGRRPWAKLIRSASLQRVFDAAISKLLCRLVSRCFGMSIYVCFYDNVELRRMRCISTKQSPDGDTEMSLTVRYAVCRLLDKLHVYSNILCTCNIFIKMWAQI